MDSLEEVFQKVGKFPNGEQVARRMMQLWDYALDPNGEPETAQSVIRVIEAHEERLLHRSQFEIVREKAVLPVFEQALRESSEEEWQEFKNDHAIEPLTRNDTERLFADASGLVRGTGFEQWVLGDESTPANIEGSLNIHQIIHEEHKGKE